LAPTIAFEISWRRVLIFESTSIIMALMVQVVLTALAQEQFLALPRVIQGRATEVFARLVKWPNVSGAKPLHGDLQGSYRIRTGDYRIVFTPSPDKVTVWKIGDRKGIYLD
jgi:mRNA-degrading endonuclease RelE of RelBE toxin-antitoxin system